MGSQHTKTIKLRVRDKHAKALRTMACEVNYIWNYCNETSSKAIRRDHRFLTGFDLNNLTSGATKYFKIGAATIQEVGEEYARKRKQFKKNKLKWRSSKGVRRSLGWIPFKVKSAKYKNGGIFFGGKVYSVWDSHGVEGITFRAGCFCEDARGRWYFCAAIDVQPDKPKGQGSVGIDLGLREVAVTSDGEKLEEGQWAREEERKIAQAQRARKKKRVKALHAKVKNRRRDALHKFSKKLVKKNAAIFVGNVSSGNLTKTKMAKSVSDAGWYTFKTMLKYKSQQAGVWYEEVNEAYSTQVCSDCGAMPEQRPKGIACLGMSEWVCDCGSVHDRNVNAAKNIRAAGHRRLAEGIPFLKSCQP